jgi:ribonucleoside-diphosphate reductase beta chain
MPDITKKFTGANWNEQEDTYTQAFYEQNLSQFWRPEDISLQPDLNVWSILPEDIKDVYAKNLLVLTFLDTYQGNIGMPAISIAMPENSHQRKSVLNFMASMENAIHAKSYSNIFMTFLTTKEIDELFRWGENNPHIQKIMSTIVSHYETLDKAKNMNKESQEYQIKLWKAMSASVFLETWLFYSGFYYPLYFYGQGKLMQAGEIINLIIRDESIHGLYVGILSQEIYNNFNEALKEELKLWLLDLVAVLYETQNELVYELYGPVNLIHDVNNFVKYNANKALMNLGFDPFFNHENVNPIVLNGLNTETKTHDFFSMKGTGYQKMKTESLSDDDFNF